MRKEKPEVGDVWEHDDTKIRRIIVYKDNDCIAYFSYIQFMNGRNYFLKQDYDDHSFPRNNTYLGKSKANINDLFEVEQ